MTVFPRLMIAPILWGFFLSAGVGAGVPVSDLPFSSRLLSGSGSPTEVFQADTLRVLAIRVEFQPDTISTTTGNGTFGSGIPEDIIIDPLPHDRQYFEDHIAFLQDYFGTVSKGKVTIADDYAVYPEESGEAYTLPNQMWHYNYNSPDPADLDRTLAELFRDSWEAAAADPDVNAEGYDLFIIYHAGVGQDFDVGFDETPHDIPSAYFDLDDLRDALGDPNFAGIPVGDQVVTGGLLLPESEYQPEAGVEIALNGTEVLLMGHWLGLPALYNTETGHSGVGRFDFMDQGSGNFAGMVPSRPGAWTRAFMGWEEPVYIHPQAQNDTFYVKQVQVDTTLPEIYRVDLNASEYYLIENRSGDPDGLEYTYAWDRQGRRLKINRNYTMEILDGGFGVIVRVDNYDFGLAALPNGAGEGILIWHVDEKVIEEKYADNAVNNDRARRGVHIVEGDGADDIGREYGIFGTQDLGWWGDFWFAGNEAFLAANPDLGKVRLFDGSHPATRAHDGSYTGIEIAGFSGKNPVMSFTVKNTMAREGFPRKLVGPSGTLSPSALDFDSDGQTDWILALTEDGAVQAFDNLGAAKGGLFVTRTDTNLLGDVTQVTDTLLAQVGGISAAPAVHTSEDGFTAYFPGDTFQFYRLEVSLSSGTVTVDTIYTDITTGQSPALVKTDSLVYVIAAAYNKIYIFDGDLNVLDLLLPFDDFDLKGITGFCLADTVDLTLFVLSEGGRAALVEPFTDQPDWTVELPFTPAFAPLTLVHQNDGRRDLAVVGENGEVLLLDPETGAFRSGFPFYADMPVTAPPAAADFDRDGFLDLVLIGENRIAAVQANGALMANWLLHVDNRRQIEAVQSPPLICELDDELRVVFGWQGGSVDARSRESAEPDGFPLSTGATIASAPLLAQLDPIGSGGESELIVLDQDGGLYVWNLDQMGFYDQQRKPWNGWRNGNYRWGIAYDPVAAIPPPSDLLVETKVYPWPNPATDKMHIRYKLGQSGTITVRIFDGAGDLVKELRGSGEAGLEYDLVWNLDGVSSGVYIGRVEATGGGNSETTFIKMAVIK